MILAVRKTNNVLGIAMFCPQGVGCFENGGNRGKNSGFLPKSNVIFLQEHDYSCQQILTRYNRFSPGVSGSILLTGWAS